MEYGVDVIEGESCEADRIRVEEEAVERGFDVLLVEGDGVPAVLVGLEEDVMNDVLQGGEVDGAPLGYDLAANICFRDGVYTVQGSDPFREGHVSRDAAAILSVLGGPPQ